MGLSNTTITFSVTVTTLPSPNVVSNTGSLSATSLAVINSNTVNTSVNFASLSGITKFVDKSFATCGERITYTVVAPNTGNVTALNVLFKDTIPNGTSLVANSVFINNVLQTGANPATGITLPDIAPGATSTVVFSVLIQC